MLRELYGDKLSRKPSILAHHNPYDIQAESWSEYDKVVVNNGNMKRVLKDAELIPNSVDFDDFKWNDDYTDRKIVLMVAQRIEGSKGIEPVARACAELGYQFVLVGEISDAGYFAQIAQHNITFLERISDEELIETYRKSAILVINSKDSFESGTLPLLEAMAIGVPVLTRMIGHVPDMYNERNLAIIEGQPDDYEELRIRLKDLMENRDKRLIMREEAWHTVRNYTTRRRARTYSKLYNKMMYKNPLVSVILPVYGRAEKLQDMLNALSVQTYPAIEIIVVSDGDKTFDNLEMISTKTLKYKRVGTKEDYGLGLARDTGALMAEGSILVLLDQRFLPAPDMVEEFVKHLKPKMWLYGNKNNKRNFVENVSCLYRQEYIEMGMSNILMNGYGGMSQELRERSKRQGFKHVFVESARAEATYSSHNYNAKKDQIYEMKERLWELNLT